MSRFPFVSFIMMSALPLLANAQSPSISIIPEPVSVSPGTGAFVVRADTRIVGEASGSPTAAMLAGWLAPATGFAIRVAGSDANTTNAILLRLDPSLAPLGNEGYVLDVTPERVSIRAATDAGLFYGAETLRQLLPPAVFSSSRQERVEWTVPAVHIEDHPRFSWRGAHLDVSRHFMPKEFVLRFLDLLAIHKLNTFHWHLTDDQGWRIEIRKYPLLTKVGGFRAETRLGHELRPRGFDGQPHGGFYTQKDIREVVAYAAARHINVVPEIEMPGHAQAAIAAYPRLGVTGKPLAVWTRWGINPNIFNPSEETIHFLQDVLTEVLELFPGRFIHIGGDEAIKEQWKASPEVQARIRQLGLKDEHEMQSYVVKRMDEFLTARGRRLVGWDEILDGGLAPGATVMSWRGVQGGIDAAKAGHDVVMAPGTHTYLDHYQSLDPGEPLAIGHLLPLETVYDFEPVPPSITPAEAHHVLGTQAQIWTEYLASPGYVEYMAYPRLTALAEVAWTPAERKNYGDFLSRLSVHVQRLENLGVNYRPLDDPIVASPGFALRSSDVREGGTLPDSTVLKGLDCSGPNISPHLQWTNAPAATRSFVLVLNDYQARAGDGFVHWAVYNIPATVTEVPSNAGASEGDIAGVGRQAFNDFLHPSYGGPCPPPGDPHVYRFTLYAIDLPVIDDAGTPMTWRKLRVIIDGHTLAQTSLNTLRGGKNP
jgi:hexosaminidase